MTQETILVTGGAGFIGSHVIDLLLEGGKRVVCIDNFDEVYERRFKEQHIAPFLGSQNFVLEEVDIRDTHTLDRICAQYGPDAIIHLAAKADTRSAVDEPHIYIDVNIVGTMNILEMARKYKVKRVVMASSSSVYGNSSQLPWREVESADRPLSPYGMTKRATELLGHTYTHNFGIAVTCLRYFNAYGENNRPTMVPYVWTQALLEGKPIQISGDGSRSRDYTYVRDVADATVRALRIQEGFQVLNIGNSHPVSLKELLATLEKVTGKSAQVISRPSHSASVENTYADISLAKEVLGWEPTTTIEQGLTQLVKWFREKRMN